MMKKLLLIVVDACTPRVLTAAMRDGKLPNLGALARSGVLDPTCSTIFPSITPAATTSIVTGCYPREHGIAGAFWYDKERDEIAYFGDDFWVIVNEGMGKFFGDFLVKLNHDWLKAETLFQTIERAGLKAACLNYFVYRGDVEHKVHVPLLLSLLPGIPFSEVVCGPSTLSLGDFVSSSGDDTERWDEKLEAKGGMFRHYGFADDSTAEVLIRMAKERTLPDFTLAYFPDYDLRSHEDGPDEAVEELAELDAKLGEFFQVYGGVERALKELCIMLTADHSQSHVGDNRDAAIRLDEVLEDFSLADAGEPWDADDQLMICPNMRLAQIYFRRPTASQLDRVVARLLFDERIDQIIWRDQIADKGGRGYRVITRDRGSLHFWSGAGSSNSARDQQGGEWSWSGDLRVVGGQVSYDGLLTFTDYPNAFERIAGGLDYEEGGHLWVTAHLGYEFCVPRAKIHAGGGSHGSLHAADSTVPLLLAGAPEGINLPPNPRIVDVSPLCLSILGLKPSFPVGTNRNGNVQCRRRK